MLTEPDTSNAGNAARFLIRSARHASLGTVMEDGSPYVSLVGIAAEGGGAPVVFISSLAQHTMNLRRTPVASLLVDGGGGLEGGIREHHLHVHRLQATGDEHVEREELAR